MIPFKGAKDFKNFKNNLYEYYIRP